MYGNMNVEIFAVLGYYTEWIGSYLPTFRDNLSVHLEGSSSPRRL